VDIGIGLPVTIAGAGRTELLDWARRAEARGFASLGTLDRIAYPNYDPLIALAAAGAVTERIRLATTVLLGAARGSIPVLAKQAMSVHRLSGDRLVLGLAVGARPDDYRVAGVPFDRRGRLLDALAAGLRTAWEGENGEGAAPLGPPLLNGHPGLLIGGHSEAAIRRAARFADGWIAGGSSVDPYAVRVERVRKAWADAGRTDQPRQVAITYFALGADPGGAAARTLGAFYANTGPYAQRAIDATLTSPATIRAAVREHADAGCDELILMPCSADPAQVDLLAEVTHG
jgi:alkanesulfonate monooxygenase SsuD/methylene tetrahydromethanopterin reductase-like flavin-dependent oxidoreductase (luciferase family)